MRTSYEDRPAASSRSAGPTRAQLVVGRVGQALAILWIVGVFLPSGIGEPTDWGEVLILGSFIGLVVAAPLFVIATGTRSPYRATRLVCAFCALPGVVFPTILIVANWSGNSTSGNLSNLASSGAVICVCLAIFLITVVSDRRSRTDPEGGQSDPTSVDLSDPWTRWSLVGVGVVTIGLVVFGVIASQQSHVIEHGTWTEPNAALLSPDNAVEFYGAALLVALLGLLGVWAVSRVRTKADVP